MDKIKIAIVGYGNIGQYAVKAVESAPDMELVGIVRRNSSTIDGNIKVVDDIKKLGKVDVALLCIPTRQVEKHATEYLAMGINTVDSYDIHGSIWELRTTLETVAKANGATAIISAGWDPGSDSVVRALMEACAPKGITYTDFGPGMSMGHTVAAKSIQGVVGALSMTIPTGTGIHRRVVYVQLEQNAILEEVTAKIKADAYFAKDELHVIKVDNIEDYLDSGHGVNIARKGSSSNTDNQNFKFSMSITNPALTSQIMLSCARATIKQKPGAYTMIEIPTIDYLPGDRESIIRRIV